MLNLRDSLAMHKWTLFMGKWFSYFQYGDQAFKTVNLTMSYGCGYIDNTSPVFDIMQMESQQIPRASI